MKDTHNHAFDLAFQMNSTKADWSDCLKDEKERVKAALLKRVEDIFKTDEYTYAISGFDTIEEVL